MMSVDGHYPYEVRKVIWQFIGNCLDKLWHGDFFEFPAKKIKANLSRFKDGTFNF